MNTIEITDKLEAVLMCAVRYAVGRNTYMPGLVQDYIMGNFSGKLSRNTLTVMLRDIEENKRIQSHIVCTANPLTAHDNMLALGEWCRKELAKMDGGKEDEIDRR